MLTISVVVACSSVDSGTAPPGMSTPNVTTTPPSERPPPRVETEVARSTIGPAGGTVSGAGATIEVPEGALSADTTIVIKILDPVDVTLPLRGRPAGAVYAFEPDDVVFLKPVKITVAVSPPRSGRGVVFLLRSPKALSNWEVRGGGAAIRRFVESRTDHFSDWAPVTADEESCLLDVTTCPADDGAGIDCSVPTTRPTVHCTGAASAYACTCFGQSAVIATFDEVPSPSALSALAVACGSSCEDADAGSVEDAGADADVDGDVDSGDASPSVCEPVVSCETWAASDAGDDADASDPDASDADASDPDAAVVSPESGWRCITLSTTRTLACDHVHGTTTATCSCGADEEADGGSIASFTIAATDELPTAAQFARAWREHCAGLCITPTADAGSDAAACLEPGAAGCAPDAGTSD